MKYGFVVLEECKNARASLMQTMTPYKSTHTHSKVEKLAHVVWDARLCMVSRMSICARRNEQTMTQE